MLKQKQSIRDNNEWIKALEYSTELYSKAEIDTLTDKTIKSIVLYASTYSNVCSGYCAGKDSLVLHDILKKSGIRITPIMWRGVNEYPAMTEWIEKNKPTNLLINTISKYSLEFLEAHPKYLFCPADMRNNWMSEKWKRYKKDIPESGFDLFITGRRLKDGNQCGKKELGYIKTGKTFDTMSPLAEWNHEQLLAYIKYNNIELPPLYSWPRGFLIGSVAMGEWTERPMGDLTEKEVWKELYRIDKNIVVDASKVLTRAKVFLEELEKDGN